MPPILTVACLSPFLPLFPPLSSLCQRAGKQIQLRRVFPPPPTALPPPSLPPSLPLPLTVSLILRKGPFVARAVHVDTNTCMCIENKEVGMRGID